MGWGAGSESDFEKGELQHDVTLPFATSVVDFFCVAALQLRVGAQSEQRIFSVSISAF